MLGDGLVKEIGVKTTHGGICCPAEFGLSLTHYRETLKISG